MSTVRQYGPAWIAAEFLAWILFPVGLLWMLYDRAARWAGSTPQQRVTRMIRWYPEAWRVRHGEEFPALLRDAIAAGEDGPGSGSTSHARLRRSGCRRQSARGDYGSPRCCGRSA